MINDQADFMLFKVFVFLKFMFWVVCVGWCVCVCVFRYGFVVVWLKLEYMIVPTYSRHGECGRCDHCKWMFAVRHWVAIGRDLEQAALQAALVAWRSLVA